VLADRIEVSRAISLGEIRTTKTGRSRSVPLMAPLAEDLRRWKLASGGRHDDLVFPRRDGGPWDENAYRRFIRGRLRPACEKVGIVTDMPAYVLRHAAASLKLASGLSVETADHMGHSPPDAASDV
jgi:integrase